MDKEFEKRKEILKQIIKELHAGSPLEELKQRFANFLTGLKA